MTPFPLTGNSLAFVGNPTAQRSGTKLLVKASIANIGSYIARSIQITAATLNGVSISAGSTLSIPTLSLGGSPSSIGAATNAASNLVLSGGSTLLYLLSRGSKKPDDEGPKKPQ